MQPLQKTWLCACIHSQVTVDRANIEVLLSGVSFPPRQSLVAQADFKLFLQPGWPSAPDFPPRCWGYKGAPHT